MRLRSLLFLPATRLDRLDKALASGADTVVLDLEDGVGPGDKAAARAALGDLAGGRLASCAGRIAVRINALATPEGIRDMAALLDWPCWPAMIVVPKVEAAAEVRQVAALVSAHSPAPALLLTIETARGIAAAQEVAGAAPPGAVLGYGSADHMAETGGTMCAASLAFGRGQIVNAAAACGLRAVDGVWLDFRDRAGLEAEARLVRSMGFAGKIGIHPDQVPPINAVFSPTPEELAQARALLEAEAAAGGGAFAVNGRMVDAPVLARARRTVEAMEGNGKA